MRHSLIGLNDRNHNVIALSSFSSSSTNKTEIEKMKQMMKKAILNELTSRQRDCLMMYYFENKNIEQIAKALCVCKSTVSRHIKCAEKKLKNIAKYY